MTEPDLAGEIAGLREEFAALRDHLQPKDEPESDDTEFKGKTLAEAHKEALIRVRAHTRAKSSPQK